MNLPNDFLQPSISRKDWLRRSYMAHLDYSIGDDDVDIYECMCANISCAQCSLRSARRNYKWNNVCPICSCELKCLPDNSRNIMCRSCWSMTHVCVDISGDLFITAMAVLNQTAAEIMRVTDDLI